MTTPDAGAPSSDERSARIDRLLDAIDLLKDDHRPEARAILRDLIRADGDFVDAWLWMSVAVDHLDQAAVCLDNVLRVDPDNIEAAAALYRIRRKDIAAEAHQRRLRTLRDLSVMVAWVLVLFSLCAILTSATNEIMAPVFPTVTPTP